jgi:hypothetical protein
MNNTLQRTQSVQLDNAVQRLDFGNSGDPPVAPEDEDVFSPQDYKIAEFNDLNDNDLIYVRWSVPHGRAYMYSNLDRPTQWVGADWTIRRTIDVGMGMGRLVDEYDFEIEDIFSIEHRERLADDGMSEFVFLHADNDVDSLKIERILNSRWNSYAANKICFSFQVS